MSPVLTDKNMKWVKIRKILVITGSVISISAIFYLAFILYLVTNGYRDYEKFCSEYIPLLEAYKLNKGHYPTQLMVFEKPSFYPRYSESSCRYIGSETHYSFRVDEGIIGWSFYNSDRQRWRHD